MKIIIINGSPRKSGATATLLKRMNDFLIAQSDVEVVFINLSDYSLLPCSGCMHCYRNGICCQNDRLEEINAAICESDGLIIGSPTYSGSMSGLLKVYIDRSHFVLEQALKNKYTFALSTYEIAGGSGVTSALKTLLRYAGGHFVDSYTCKVVFNTLSQNNSESEKIILKKAEKFYKVIDRRDKKPIFDRVINYIALNLIMKPQVLKRPDQYSAVIKRWKEIDTTV